VGDRIRGAGFDVTVVRASAVIKTQMSHYGIWDDFILRCERSKSAGSVSKHPNRTVA
jgi:hypothetical protein